jgi:hypothetical protein
MRDKLRSFDAKCYQGETFFSNIRLLHMNVCLYE